MPALCQLAVFSFATAVPEGTGGSHWLCQPLFKPPGQCRPGVLGSSEWSSAMLRDPLGQSLWGDRPFVPVKSCSKSSLLGQRCHQQVPPVGARAGGGGSHQMFVPAASSPQTLICTDGWGRGWSVSLPRPRGCGIVVLLGKKENKESSLHHALIHPTPGTGRSDTASSTPRLALLSSPPQPANSCSPLQGSGCSEGWAQRAAPVP